MTPILKYINRKWWIKIQPKKVVDQPKNYNMLFHLFNKIKAGLQINGNSKLLFQLHSDFKKEKNKEIRINLKILLNMWKSSRHTLKQSQYLRKF